MRRERGFNIASYTDNAEGHMAAMEDGKEWISKITLDPQIKWIGERVPTAEELAEMHHAAHEGCYIANSIKSEIVVK